MRRLIFTYIILLIIVFCTSCSDKQYQTLFETNGTPRDTARVSNDLSGDHYKIKSQDILQIRNLQNIKYITDETPVSTNISTAGGNTTSGQTYQVDDNGNVSLPVIGPMAVGGLTRSQAQKLIQDTYSVKLLKDPIIDLKIINLKITLLGEVKTPGNYILTKDKTTLVEVIGEAGGLSPSANEKNIKIIRGTGKNPEVNIVDLSNISSISAPDAVLQSGDIIYVGQNKRAARTGNLQNFSVIAQPVLLLFNTALIVLTLIRR